METNNIKYKTSMKCSGCVATATPYLDGIEGVTEWSVDLASPEKVLTASGDFTSDEVVEALRKAGFSAEKIA